MILTLQAKCKAACTSGSGYLNKNGSSCVLDCNANDFGRKINSVGTKCVDSCGDDEWFDSANNKCKKCINSGTMMIYCTKCNGTNSC